MLAVISDFSSALAVLLIVQGVPYIYVFRSHVQGAQINSRSMQQTLSGALRGDATFSRGADRYSRRDERPRYGVPPRVHVPWRGTRVPGIPHLLLQGS